MRMGSGEGSTMRYFIICTVIKFFVFIMTNFFNQSYLVKIKLKVFVNRIIRRIFGDNRYENGEWRKFYNMRVHSYYHSRNLVRVVKSRMLRWAGHVARMEEDVLYCIFMGWSLLPNALRTF